MTRFILAITASVTALSTATAVAEDGGAQSVVMIVKVGEEGAADPLIRAASSQLSDLEVVLKPHPEPDLPQGIVAWVTVAARVLRSHQAIAVFWRDPSPEGRVHVFYFKNETARIISRDVELPEAGEPSEAVAIIVRQTVAEILAGEELGEEAPFPPPRPDEPAEEPPGEVPDSDGDEPTPPSPTVPSFHRLQVSAGYTVQLQASKGMLVHGPALGLGVRVHRQVEIFAGYRFVWPTRIEDTDASLEIARHPVHLGLRAFVPTGRFRLGGAAALVVDYQTVDISELSPGLAPTTGDGEVELAVTADLEAGLEIVGWLWLRLALGAELQLTRQYYYLPDSSAGGQRVLFDPWPVQPRVVLGLAGEFL
jgi:hypothetical protein